MKKFLILLLACLLFLSGCGAEKPARTDIFAMDTLMNIKIWGDEALLSEVTERIYTLENALSVTEKGSEVALLNESGRAELSEDALEILTQALFYSEKTGGAFDITVCPLVKAWGFSTEEQHLPSEETITSLLAFVGSEHIRMDGQTVILDEGTELDFGGVAKGFAAQLCAEYLREQGVEAALLSLGGNVQTLGTKPDGSQWVIGISDPREPSSAIAELRFTGSMALVTSGSYQRYFEENGARYHHILDPETGKPADNGLASVTVLAENSTMADAYSTALFVMGLEEATEFWRQEQNFEAVFILEDGNIYATTGAAELLSGCEFTEIKK